MTAWNLLLSSIEASCFLVFRDDEEKVSVYRKPDMCCLFCRLLLIPVLLALVSCVSRQPVHQEQGWASYVADHYAGRPTASGQIYYPQAFTAAHATLPFGTVLTVKNLMNGRSVKVTVNDRFPYYPSRVVNLSSAAAQQIGIPYQGMGQVQITASGVPNLSPAGRGSSQRSSFASPSGSKKGGPHSTPPLTPGYAPSGSYTPQPTYQPQPSISGYGSPAAPGYGGQNVTPPGLKTF